MSRGALGLRSRTPWHRAALIGAAFYCGWRGIRYSAFFGHEPENLPRGLELIGGSFIPIEVWSILWLAGAVAAIGALWVAKAGTVWGFIGGLILVWGLAYVAGGIALYIDPELGGRENAWSSWTTATSYLVPALWIVAATSPSAHEQIARLYRPAGRGDDA